MTLADELERLGKLATEGDWFAGPLQPKEDTGAPGGVSIGPFDLAEKWGGRSDYSPEVFCDHYEDQIALTSGANHDAEANAALIVALRNNLPAIIAALRAQEHQQKGEEIKLARRDALEEAAVIAETWFDHHRPKQPKKSRFNIYDIEHWAKSATRLVAEDIRARADPKGEA